MTVASVLFAAGRGERLRPLTDTVPKAALPLLDVPLGAFGLTALCRVVPPVAVNASHLGAELVSALAPYMPPGRVEILDEGREPFGTGGTLVALRDRIGERVLTWSGDLLTDLDPRAVMDAHRRSGAPATVAVRRVERGADFVPGGGRVAELIDRRREPQRAGWLFLNPAVFEAEVLRTLPDDRPLGLTEGLLGPLIERGDLHAVEAEAYWTDVGTPARYLRASLDLLEGHMSPPGGRWPGRIVDVPGGRAYVGPGAAGEAGSLGPGAILLRGGSVGSGGRVEEAIVGPGETVPPGAEVHRAIMWAGEVVGA